MTDLYGDPDEPVDHPLMGRQVEVIMNDEDPPHQLTGTLIALDTGGGFTVRVGDGTTMHGWPALSIAETPQPVDDWCQWPDHCPTPDMCRRGCIVPTPKNRRTARDYDTCMSWVPVTDGSRRVNRARHVCTRPRHPIDQAHRTADGMWQWHTGDRVAHLTTLDPANRPTRANPDIVQGVAEESKGDHRPGAEESNAQTLGRLRFRVGGSWGVTIVQEGAQPADTTGRRSDDRLVAVTQNDPELAERICDLLNADESRRTRAAGSKVRE